jgi:hypothetical protein
VIKTSKLPKQHDFDGVRLAVPHYPMWEITSKVRKEDYATGAEEMKPPPSGPSIPPGGPAPGYHTASSRSSSTIPRFLRNWWVTEIVSWLFALVSLVVVL